VSGLQIFNALEAVWWLALAALALVAGSQARGMNRRRQAALVLFLTALGISDIWEALARASGWQFFALVAFKGVCLIGLAVTAILIFRCRWSRGGRCA
jgi:hypothetical protein